MDIVDELRQQADADEKAGTLYSHVICRNAANDIERLRAALRKRVCVLLTSDAIENIARDGRLNAAGGVYATRVQEFAVEVQREFASVNGLFVNSCG